jgi:phospholipid/cholesterol/gamma-HCH transport system substrate-binding protein
VSRRTEIQVGATVLVALAITLWGVTWLKELSIARKVQVWHVIFPQTGGLSSSDEVQVNGLRKGSVQSVALVGDHVVVDLALASDVALTTDSRVAVRNVGLMGEKVIAVDLRATGTRIPPGDTLVGLYEKGVPEVMAELGGTMNAINSLAGTLDRLATSAEREGDLERALANFRAASEDLRAAVAENRATLRETLANFEAASRTAKALTSDREARLTQTLDSFERSAEGLERLTARLDSLGAVVQSVAAKADRGDGTLGRVVNDPKLYQDAQESIAELKALIADIRKNPKKYLHLSVF